MGTVRLIPLLGLCWLVQDAAAEPRIVIVETRGTPTLPTLASQVTMHAAATVEVQQQADADPLTFVERASQLVAAGTATLVVWMAPVDHGYLVFVAGRGTGRALTELVRVDVALGAPEIERTIALKIAALLDAVLVEPGPTTRATLDTIAPPVPHVRAWRLEIDGTIAYETHERKADGRIGFFVGRAWQRGPWTLVPSIGGYWQPSGTIERAGGRASLLELGGIAAVEASRDLGPVEVLARPRLVAAAISARGVSDDGRRGTATVFAPYPGIEVGVRHAVANVGFGVVGGCDVALIRRELIIDNKTIVDFGALRLHVGLALTVAL